MNREEANAWYGRNQGKLSISKDPVIQIIERNISLHQYSTIYEIGCANGWRLRRLRDKYGCHVEGCDLSSDAIENALRVYNLQLLNIDFLDASTYYKMDVLISGFFLYTLERADLMKCVYLMDDITADGGYIVIHDFISEHPHSCSYEHDKSITTYKMNHSKLLTANPSYTIVDSIICKSENPRSEDDMTGVVLLKKDIKAGWPLID